MIPTQKQIERLKKLGFDVTHYKVSHMIKICLFCKENEVKALADRLEKEKG